MTHAQQHGRIIRPEYNMIMILRWITKMAVAMFWRTTLLGRHPRALGNPSFGF